MKLDTTDLNILRALSINSSLSTKEIAAQVNLSISPVHDRIKKLENYGIINRHTIMLDVEKLNFNLIVYLQIRLIQHKEGGFEEFGNFLLKMNEVIEAAYTAGEFDVMVKLMFKDMNEYHHFILHKISKLDAVSFVKSSFAVKFITGNYHTINPNRLLEKP